MGEAILINHIRKIDDGSKFYDNYTNIGNKETLDGATHNNAGYFGTVTSAQLFTGAEIATATGISQGTLQNDSTNWLKFYIDGKIVFIPMKSIRYSVPWDTLNTAGCVFGDKIISKDGIDFKVRLMRGATTDPAITDATTSNTIKYSEYNRLILPLLSGNEVFNSEVHVNEILPKWDTFNNLDLHVSTSAGNGRNHLCQEGDSANPTRKLFRGGVSLYASGSIASSSTNAYYGWKPVLEVIPPNQ